MTTEQEEKISEEIMNQVGWIENGEVKQLSEAALFTIMSIIRTVLGREE